MFLLKIAFLLCLAQAEDNVTYLEKGTQVPFSGYVFTPEAEQKARLGLIERDHYKSYSENQNKQIELLNKNNEIYEKRLENVASQNSTLFDKVAQSQSVNKIENAVYFLSGALITGAIGYGIYTTVK